MPVTSPDEAPIVAMDGLPLIQLPAPGSVRVVVFPGHMAIRPEMGPGKGLIVTTAVTWQPDKDVNVITEVAGMLLPVTMPVSIPVDDPIVAAAGTLLVQLPARGGSLRVALVPWQRLKVPVMAPGAALSVTVAVAAQPLPDRV